jgi:DNA-binding Lrp family transcriptional regulator
LKKALRVAKLGAMQSLLDDMDRKILELLQVDGRLSNAEIAEKIGLSAPACWKRLKRLEKQVIQDYYATLNQQELGLWLFAARDASRARSSDYSDEGIGSPGWHSRAFVCVS